MNQKYTVIVRIRVKGSKHVVTGTSSYNNDSYDKKFKNAVLNAVYIDADKRHIKIRYDTKYNYELVSSSVAYVGKPVKRAKNKNHRKLHQEIIMENKNRVEKEKIRKKQEKELDKPISKQQQQKELYGKNYKETRKELQYDIKDEKKASRDYMKLSKRLKGRDRMTVQKIAKQEKQHEKELIKIDRNEYLEFQKWKAKQKKK